LWRLFSDVPRGWDAFHSGHVSAEIAFALNFIYQLVEIGTMKLGEDHSKVVFGLWIMNASDDVVSIDELKKLVEGKVDPNLLSSVLMDLERMRIIRVDQENKQIEKREQLFLE
jgi:hypothetical protein